MTIIADKDRATVRDLLARELVHDVELVFFTRSRSSPLVPSPRDCVTCDETRELLEQLTELSDQLHLTTHDLASDPDAGTSYNVADVPTVLLRRLEVRESAASDSAPAQHGAVPNIRFLGQPAGYEFSTLVADILDVSKAETGLAPATLEAVRSVETPVHIQVFVTPT